MGGSTASPNFLEDQIFSNILTSASCTILFGTKPLKAQNDKKC